MAKVDGGYRSLLQGISQQPARDRQPGQATAQLNGLSKPIDGLTDRPPLEAIQGIGDYIDPNSAFHVYNRGDGERYIIAIHGTDVLIFDWEGNPVELRDGNPFDYLDNPDRTNTYMHTVGDYTMVINKDMVVEELPIDENEKNDFALVWVRTCGFGRKLSFQVDDTIIEYTSPDGSVVSPPSSDSSSPGNDASRANAKFNDPNYVIFRMYHKLIGTPDDEIDYPEEWEGYTEPPTGNPDNDVMHHYWATVTLVAGDTIPAGQIDVDGPIMMMPAETISVLGEGSGPDIVGILNHVREVGHLPPKSYDGHTVEVARSDEGEDSFYLQYETNDGEGSSDSFSDGDGKWVETRALGISPGLDSTTMPHALVSYLDAGTPYFEWQAIDWQERKAGDDTSNPQPRFVGTTLEGAGQFHDRLYLWANEDIHFSKTTLYDDLYKGSAAVTSDDDGFDATSATDSIQNIRHVVSNNQALIAFTDNAQFLLDGKEPVTPSTAHLSLTTSFDGNLGVRPIANGNVVYFAYEAGAYTGIKEFFPDSLVDTNDARAITSHVERYIPGNDVRLVASNQENMLFVHPFNTGDVYVYQYVFDDQRQRIQSAWHKWEGFTNILFFWFDRTNVHVIYRDEANGEDAFGVLNLQDNPPPNMPYNPRLDARYVTITDSLGTIPWGLPTSEGFRFVVGDGPDGYQGMEIGADAEPLGGRLRLRSPLAEGTEIYVGIPYTFEYTPTRPFVLDQNEQSITTDPLNITTYNLQLNQTGQANVRIQMPYVANPQDPNDRSLIQYDIPFDGRITGSQFNRVGEVALYTGPYPFMVGLDAADHEVTVWKDAPVPLNILDWDWVGNYTPRGQRL